MNILSNLKNKKIISIFICSMLIFGIIVGFINFEKILKGNEVCIVQFEPNGGTFIEHQEIKCGTIISEPNKPQKAGFSFKYWEYNGEKYDFSKPIESNTILKPFYEREEDIDVIIVSFNTRVEYKIDDIEIKKGEKLEKPIPPVMTGFKFAGWYSGNKEFNFEEPIYKNITLEAKWAKDISNVGTKENNKTDDCKFALNNGFKEIYNATLYNGKVEKISIEKAFNQYWYYNDKCKVTYNTSNDGIATIDKDGVINILKEGSAIISSCIYNKKDNKELECFEGKVISKNINKILYDDPKVSYERLKGKWYPKYSNVSYIKFSNYKVVEENNYQTFTYEFYGINENDLSYSCQSGKCLNLYDRSEKKYSDKSILSFEAKYSPKIVNNKLYLTINGKTVEFSREKSVVPIESFSLNKESTTIKVGATLSISAYVIPNNATNAHIIWESGDELVAEITNRNYNSYTNNGSVTTAYIKTLSPGIVTFTAKTRDGKEIRKFILTVTE